MAIVTFSNGTKAKASEVNNNFSYVGMVPIGTVMPWLKSYTNTPALDSGFVECNGQVLSDAASVYNGQTIPDLNGTGGTKRFLRGSSTSGTTGGADSINLQHRHLWAGTGGGATSPTMTSSGGLMDLQLSASQSILPSYYEVVFIMRIK